MEKNKENNISTNVKASARRVHFFSQDIEVDFEDHFERAASSSTISTASSNDIEVYTYDDYGSSDSMGNDLLNKVPTIEDDTESSLSDEGFDYSQLQDHRKQSFMTSGYEFVILRSLITEKEMEAFKEIYNDFFERSYEFQGIKLNMSDPILHMKHYVVTISGMQCQVAQIYGKIAKHFALKEIELSNGSKKSKYIQPKVIRLLIPHSLLRNWEGRKTLHISSIEHKSCAKVTVHSDMLPYSTEKLVTIQGSSLSIEKAVIYLSQFMGLEWERSLLVIRFIPSMSLLNSSNIGFAID